MHIRIRGITKQKNIDENDKGVQKRISGPLKSGKYLLHEQLPAMPLSYAAINPILFEFLLWKLNK